MDTTFEDFILPEELSMARTIEIRPMRTPQGLKTKEPLIGVAIVVNKVTMNIIYVNKTQNSDAVMALAQSMVNGMLMAFAMVEDPETAEETELKNGPLVAEYPNIKVEA